MLADVFAWNKLFRRTFFDRAVGAFPEGIRYEDQEPSAKAYSSAAAFDVLHEVVYSWYIRGDGTSITQQKSSLLDLADRLTVMASVADVLRERASEAVLREWQAKSVGLDLRAYYNEVPRTGEDYWQALARGVCAVTKDMDEQAWGLVSLHDRLLARMVEQGHRDDVRIALRRRSEVGDAWETDVTLDPPVARPLYLDDLETYRPTAADLALTRWTTGCVSSSSATRWRTTTSSSPAWRGCRASTSSTTPTTLDGASRRRVGRGTAHARLRP